MTRPFVEAMARVPGETRALIGALCLAIVAIGVAAPMIAKAYPIVTPPDPPSVVVKDQARVLPPLSGNGVLYTREDPWTVHVVPTISYRGDHYEARPRRSADDAENARIEQLREQQKGKSKNKRSHVLMPYRLASLAPMTRDDAGEGVGVAAEGQPELELPEAPRGADVEADPENAYAAARAYVAVTATPGGTMARQGREKAVACLHPEFVLRLAAAIKEARTKGLSDVGVFSACRPPAFGVGGFADKFNSLHAYGLAVDVHGIGSVGSHKTRLWHQVARRHGVVCPYGPNNRAEFNHCQPTNLKVVARNHPLRKTITKNGPISLEQMWSTAKSLIVNATKG